MRNLSLLMRWLSIAVVIMLFAVTLSACGEEAEPEAGVEEPVEPGVEEPLEEEPLEEEPLEEPSPELEASPSPEVEASPSPEASPEAGAGEPGVEGGVTLNEITTEPDTYIGQTVTVQGLVNVVLSEQAFSIAENTLLDLNEVLVLSAEGAAVETALERELPVQVTGAVRRLVVAEIEEELGIDLDQEVEAEFEDRPVIIAESVQPVEGNVTLGDITADPQALAGQTVTVNGGVNVVLTETAFTIAESTFLDQNEVLVVGATEEALQRALQTGSPVRVTGTVRTFNQVEVEEELGRDLEDEVFTEFEGQPMILAESVLAIDAANVTLEEINENPEAYFGRLVAVEGNVVEVFSERAFSIVSDELIAEDAVLVLGVNEEILADLETELAAEQQVQVTGTVRQLVVAEIEEDLGFDLDPELEAEFESQPVIIATNVQVVNGAAE